MEGWVIALILKPFAAIGVIYGFAKIHVLVDKLLPDGKLKTALLGER